MKNTTAVKTCIRPVETRVRYEIHLAPFKTMTKLTIYDDYWDDHETVYFRPGHPEEAIDWNLRPLVNPCIKALRDEIATLAPGWYAIQQPRRQYPFGHNFHTFRLIQIPGRHLRHKHTES